MDAGELFDEFLEGTVNRKHQVEAGGVHVTLAEVAHLRSHGKVDFGGSELEPCASYAMEPTGHSPGDQYAWWRLNEGRFMIRFNERLKAGAPPALLVPSPRLLSLGCTFAPTICGEGEIKTVMVVPSCGAGLKENARIGLLHPLG